MMLQKTCEAIAGQTDPVLIWVYVAKNPNKEVYVSWKTAESALAAPRTWCTAMMGYRARGHTASRYGGYQRPDYPLPLFAPLRIHIPSVMRVSDAKV